MAKWDGGRGTVRIAEMPGDLKQAVLAGGGSMKKKRGYRRPRLRKKSPGFESTGFGVKTFDITDYVAHVAWKTKITNKSEEGARVVVSLVAFDNKGFKLDESLAERFYLEPGQSHEISKPT